MSGSLKGKTLFITGASRGIGLAIGLAAAREGANVAIAAKTVDEHAYLPGTIHSAAKAIDEAGGQGLAVRMDVRKEADVEEAVRQTVERFGGIDICVNNASAMYQATTLETEMKRFDLVHDVVARGSFMVTRACLPHLFKSDNPHVLMFCGPPELSPRHLAKSLHNTIAKSSAAMMVIGMAEEFRERGVAVNGLRPRTWIGTSAIKFRRGEEGVEHSRKPEIMADAACAIFRRPSRQCTGQFFVDDAVLYEEGERDFEQFSVVPGNQLFISGMSIDQGEIPDYLDNLIPPPGAFGENARQILAEETKR